MERAASLPHAAAGEVLCFPPRRRSAAEPELARLQAHIGPPLEPAAEGLGELPVSVMLLLICRELGLTAGKACAQVGHGVLLGVMLHQAEAVARWRAGGCPVAVGLVDDAVFDHVKRSLSVAAVRDAGLTQVRPGTETVLACMPGETLPGWLLGGARAIV
jgi:peptidyl-tRNA hydrolase